MTDANNYVRSAGANERARTVPVGRAALRWSIQRRKACRAAAIPSYDQVSVTPAEPYGQVAVTLSEVRPLNWKVKQTEPGSE
jgi:hypothetical protein